MTSQLRRPLIAGNWKMHQTVGKSVDLARAVASQGRFGPRTDVCVAPVFTALLSVADALKGTGVALAAQDVYDRPEGAFTGEVSVEMLADVGCTMCIVGHSERRQFFGETDAAVRQKIDACLGGGLVPIACLGETLTERDAGLTLDVVRRQLDAMIENLDPAHAPKLVLAYEPVWAIGTGRVAKAEDAQLVHAVLRDRVRSKLGDAAADSVRILYGGSVKPDNAATLLAQPDIDGALVGGASLDAAHFARIIHAAG